ncbi:Glutamate--tRNA ligase mitochondrial [Kalmusia sp. IMI 367209]|nr:Glutamate--tRNA ligase mitochondrial [Kalmusia sp. IMI 367209]
MPFPLLLRPQLSSYTCRSCRALLSTSSKRANSAEGVRITEPPPSPKRAAPFRLASSSKRTTRFALPLSPARTRFAPSPTGYLHLGSLRTALFNYLLAKATGGQFLLRIEDTDQKRTVPDAESRLFRDLRWAGLEWDEGPEVGGPYGPYKQSERSELYQQHAHKLLDNGHAYRCFCSAERLNALAQQRHKLGIATDYDRTCADIPKEVSDDRAAKGESHVIRLRVPDQYPTYEDLVYGVFKPLKRRGHVTESAYEDPILLKSDGLPTYHLANVVDDHHMKITHVIRGSEWMPSTPKHIAMYNAFGWKPPQFAHVGLLVDEQGNKLSKRNFDTDITAFQEMEIFPETLTNFSALLGWSHQEKSDVMDLKQLIDNFSLKFTKGNTTVTFGKLQFLQRKHAALRAKAGGEGLGDMTEAVVRLLEEPNSPYKDTRLLTGRHLHLDSYVNRVIQADPENYTNANEFVYRNSFMFSLLRHPLSVTSAEGIPQEAKALKYVESWTRDDLMVKVREIIDARPEGKKGAKDVYHYLRKALTDREDGMRIYDVMLILGRKESLARLATGNAPDPNAPPIISITAAEDDIFDPDARTVLQDWEERYTTSASPVSQAEFFAPAELLASRDASNSRSTPTEDEDIPLHPSAPRIVISEPDTTPGLPSLDQQPALKKDLRIDKKTTFLDETNNQSQAIPRLRERRHSIISLVPDRKKSGNARSQSKEGPPRPTPRPWTTTEMHPKNGWKMKVRCSTGGEIVATVDIVMVYMYNSTAGYQLDRDGDLNIFNHFDTPETRKRGLSPTRKIQRARTDLGKQPKQDVPDLFASTQWAAHPQVDAQRSRRQYVNWLTDADMLRKQIPGMRLTMVGYDIKPTLGSTPNFETAARQLHDYLQQHRHDHPRVPTVFLGHTLGGLIIIKALSDLQTKASSVDNLLLDTAGLFLFSCYTSYSQARSQMLANLYGTKSTERLFTELSKSPVADTLSKLAMTRLFSQHPHIDASDVGQLEPKKPVSVSIGFPIFQVFTRDDFEEARDATAISLSSLLSTPVRTITIDKDSTDALKFSSAQDTDFLRLVMLIQSALQTHKLLHAAALGRVEEVHSMIRRGTNVNLRDRWSQTALQIAVRMNHEKVVVKLLGAKSVDPNVRDKMSNTPLHYAVRSGNETIIRALLHNGADIGLENQRKRTPRDLAEKHRSRKHIAKLLRSKLMSGPDQSLSSKLIGTGKPPASPDGALACKNSQITVTEIYAIRNSDKHWSVNISVEALLYGPTSLNDILEQVRPQAVKADTPVCVWVHVPENNMVWLEDLFAKLRLHPAIWQNTRRSVTDSLRNRAITPHFNSNDTRSLFFPYLSYEANFRQAKRTTYIQAVDAAYQDHRNAEFPFATSALAALVEGSSKASTGERRPLLQIPQGKNLESYPYIDEDSDSDFSEILETDDPDDLEEEEKALINAYLYNPPALHIRRTLDQYYYHMLESTHERDIDQVVSRWAQNVRSEPRHNILMVDQLWLWIGQTPENAPPGELEMEKLRRRDHNRERSPDRSKVQYIISCFPNRTGSGLVSHRTLDDLRLRILDPSSRKRDPIRRPEDLVSRILETCCSAFDRMQDVEMLRFFQMFEDSIGTIDDKESRLFRDFQRGSNRLLELDNGNKYYNEKKNALLTDLLDIREEIKLLVEVKDIRDEINIILTVLSIQRTLVDQMGQSTKDGILLDSPVVANMVAADINDFTKLDSQARTIQEKLNTLMDLKQKAANAWEAKEARETAVAAGKQGNTVLVFTVVTIIFLPLSFMSSFFAIEIAAFPHHPESGEVNWPLGTVMGLLFGVSLCVSIPLILFALNMDYFTSLFKELRYHYLADLGIKVIPLLPPLGKDHEATAYRRRWTGLLQQHREDYLKNEDLDTGDIGMVRGESVMKPGVSFPSTISSHTLVEDVNDSSSHTRKRMRPFRPQRKALDDESSIGGE